MTYLLDTTWLVEYLRGNQRIVRRVDELADDGLAISIISVAELFEGVFRSTAPEANERALQDVITGVAVLDIDSETARHYGELRAVLVRQGAVMGSLDVLIAATAIRHALTLFTLDRDFERVPGLDLRTA